MVKFLLREESIQVKECGINQNFKEWDLGGITHQLWRDHGKPCPMVLGPSWPLLSVHQPLPGVLALSTSPGAVLHLSLCLFPPFSLLLLLCLLLASPWDWKPTVWSPFGY